jgi:dihydroorotate dehydrogenase
VRLVGAPAVSEDLLYALARPLLFALDPERAHHVTLETLRRLEAAGLISLLRQRIPEDPKTVMGLRFPNPVGLAAGLDKDGRYISALGALGFGFIEVGTVTPRAQPGNPRPRMFRVAGAHALVNRMGFNNGGLAAFLRNVEEAQFRGVLGLNIGKNAETPLEHAAEDYLACLEGVYPHASYVTVNVSSPNTKNLRQLQDSAALSNLIGLLKARQARLADRHGRYVPLVLKIAPDLDEPGLADVAAVAMAQGIDAIIATNTTVSRQAVQGLAHADEAGGLSGAPLLDPSNRVISLLRQHLAGAVPIIGSGGILSGTDARQKVHAGAELIQLYTGLIYRGPALVAECARSLRG